MDCLTREEMISVIEGKGAAERVPMLFNLWCNSERFKTEEERDTVRKLLDTYPMDVQIMHWRNVTPHDAPEDDPSFRWMHLDAPPDTGIQALDAHAPLSDWSMLDDMLADFPDPEYPHLWPNNPEPDGRYRLAHWWYTFYERHWSLRGMSNALMDYMMYPEETHRLFDAICAFYCRMIERAAEELKADGVYFTDDLGTQTGPFFSLDNFNDFYAPYYKRIIDTAHKCGMHAWLHSCGDITEFLPRFIELGLDVIHPIQKYAMDEVAIARDFGGQITFNAGFDVQQVIPYGTPEDVRREVRHMIDNYQRPEGRLLMTAGNGITPDTPVASLQALFEETYEYGVKKCEKGVTA